MDMKIVSIFSKTGNAQYVFGTETKVII